MNTKRLARALVLPLAIAANCLNGAEFVILDRDGSFAKVASDDGRIIVGETFDSLFPVTVKKWRWNRDDGFTVLDTIDEVKAMSAEGSVMVGHDNDINATWWDWSGTRHSLDLPGVLWDVTADGSEMVGEHSSGAFLWNNGGLHELPPLPGWRSSAARGVSDDGNVVVGLSDSGHSRIRERDFEGTVWIRQDGDFSPLGLGRLDERDTHARFVSRDGSIVVGVVAEDILFGNSRDLTPNDLAEPFRWTESTGIVPLGLLDGMATVPTSMSADGSVVVGNASAWNRNFVWDETHGMRDLQVVLREEHGVDALSDWDFIRIRMSADARTLFGDVVDCGGCTQDFDLGNTSQAFALFLDRPLHSSLKAGDSDQDLDFDQLDLVRVQIAGKYLTGEDATWGEGDWNAAPKIAGNSVFDQDDIVAALQANIYLTGPYAATAQEGVSVDSQTSLVYHAATGQLDVDVPAGAELTSINIDSAAGIFSSSPAENLGGSFDNDTDSNIFEATFGGSFGSLSFGRVAQAGLSENFLLGDLTVAGSWDNGGRLGHVGLAYVPVPEPSSVVVLLLGALLSVTGGAACHRRTDFRCPR